MQALNRRDFIAQLAGLGLFGFLPRWAQALEQRNDVSFLRGPYHLAFYKRHNHAYRLSAGMHFFHSKQHDHANVDRKFNDEALAALKKPPRIEPEMDYYSSYVDQSMRTLFRTIDWTHMHHEQTYDILADRDIPWNEKKQWTDRAVQYYLHAQEAGIPRSPAPLDVTMRRAAIMTKPYFTYFRNYYPLDQSLFYIAHWWHPAVYEAQMISGNEGQEENVNAVIRLMMDEVVERRPQRMILSRELMPRYSRLSPESANIFDNLHMLHGIAYDILAYEGWSVEEKRAEMYRVIKAMGYQPGDEHLTRKFPLPNTDLDPRLYPESLQGSQGEMSRIMMEMMEDMLPMMMPNGMSPEQHQQMMEVMNNKMMLGIPEDEKPGSLHEAIHQIMPDMQMMPEMMAPGQTHQKMVDMMMAGWMRRYHHLPDVPEIDMSSVKPVRAV
jgi:hypothetical protein